MVLHRRSQRRKIDARDIGTKSFEPGCGWEWMKRMVMGTMRWSRAKKWEEESSCDGSWEERLSSQPMALPPLLLGLEGREIAAGGWQSHNSVSPVWQRPILMGEKCELPRFSGLILYDERGRLLQDSEKEEPSKETTKQGKKGTAVRTTLKDLL